MISIHENPGIGTPTDKRIDKTTRTTQGPTALQEIREARRKQQNGIAGTRSRWIKANRYFYDRLKKVLQFIVEPGRRVLSVRCQTGHLLAAVKPAVGVGVEISEGMVACAQREHPGLHFVQSNPEELDLDQTFDYILFEHVFDTVDILTTLQHLRDCCHSQTQLVVMNYNYLWQPVLELASRVGLRSRFVEPNWVSENDLKEFLGLAGFRAIRTHRLILLPKNIPLLSTLFNDWIARLPGLRRLSLMHVVVARPAPQPKKEQDVSVSVIVPCRNERGNVQAAVERIPSMGCHTEIIFCDDKSTDGTADEVRRLQALYPAKTIRVVEGPGICKAQNVWTGFRAARNDVLMILDADLSVMPEELPMFLNALLGGRGDFVNGSRLVYPMQKYAMKAANFVGNKFFSWLFTFLLDQRIKDTLCGTKVLWRSNWPLLESHIGTWGVHDLWGDYELLFGASRLHLRIVEVPVHYQERVYGVTKMTKAFSNGVRMLGICWKAWRHLEG